MSRHKIISGIAALSLVSVATLGFAVTANDSVHSWGPWSTLVQPAAGPGTPPIQTSLAGPVVPGFGAGDAGPFTPVVVVPDGPTPDTEVIASYALINVESEEGSTSKQLATASLIPIPENPSISDTDTPVFATINNGVPLPPTVNTALSVNSITSDLSLDIDALVAFRDDSNWGSRDRLQFLQGITLNVGGVPFAYGHGDAGGAREDETGFVFTEADFIVGATTSLSDLDSLNTGNVEAVYEGRTLSWNALVVVDVDFGAGTWNGVWNGGRDSDYVHTDLTSDGVSEIHGAVGFEAEGVINGVNIVSTAIRAEDALSISGTVDGSFFGGDGGILAGVSDIDKTTDDYQGNQKDLFVTANTNSDVTIPIGRLE